MKGQAFVIRQLAALLLLEEKLAEFLYSGQQSGLGENDDPPDRDAVLAGGSVHEAIVAVEKEYDGKLPSPVPRNDWIQLGQLSDSSWQIRSHELASAIRTWTGEQLVVVIARAKLADILNARFFGEVRDEIEFRKIAGKLLPGFEAPRDIEKIAALLCKELGLQPSEFTKLKAKGRLAFAETALANRNATQTTQIDELVTLNQAAPLAGVSKRTLERWLQEGELPNPDVPGGDGRAHKWHWQTLRAALQEKISKSLPEKYPGTRIH